MATLDISEQIAPEENSFARMKVCLEQAGFEFWTTCKEWERDTYQHAYNGRECCLIPINVREDGKSLLYGVFTRQPVDRLYDSARAREDLSIMGYTLITGGFAEELPRMIQNLEAHARQRLGVINGRGGEYQFKIAVAPFNQPGADGIIEPYSYSVFGLIGKPSSEQRLAPPQEVFDASAGITHAAQPVAQVSGNARTRTFELLSRLMSSRRSSEPPRADV